MHGIVRRADRDGAAGYRDRRFRLDALAAAGAALLCIRLLLLLSSAERGTAAERGIPALYRFRCAAARCNVQCTAGDFQRRCRVHAVLLCIDRHGAALRKNPAFAFLIRVRGFDAVAVRADVQRPGVQQHGIIAAQTVVARADRHGSACDFQIVRGLNAGARFALHRECAAAVDRQIVIGCDARERNALIR